MRASELLNNVISSGADKATASFIILTAFAVCALVIVLYLNKTRKNKLDSAREQMFDLLARTPGTSFGLFETDKQSPVFLSGNVKEVTGAAGLNLIKTESGFVLRNADGAQNEALHQLNDELREWDGASTFKSGYVMNAVSVPQSYYQLILTPVSGEQGKFVGVAQDVTLLRERESAVRGALAEARRANEAKSKFLSNMSHDIRTPMNAIVNMADFAIEDMADPDKLREHLAEIRESSDHLLMLINDVLDMSRIESGSVVITAQPFDILSELRRLKSIVTPLCEAKKQTFITEFDGVHTSAVVADQVKVSQILMNLLSNAVKFTPEMGAVRFAAGEESPSRDGFTTYRFIVEDTGLGIKADFLPHIFEPFTRENTERITGIQGTGLGLSICRSYVEAMGGAINCESEEGDGSRFTVILKLKNADAISQSKPPVTAWDVKPFIGMRCLLCEDNPTNQRIAKTILERLGFKVSTAKDGTEGFKIFKSSPPNYFDVIYMDIQMPFVDGYQAAAMIRSCNHAQAKTIPIIAMTANVFAEDIEKAHISGMDGHVGKPIATSALSGETYAVLQRKRTTISWPPSPPIGG